MIPISFIKSLICFLVEDMPYSLSTERTLSTASCPSPAQQRVSVRQQHSRQLLGARLGQSSDICERDFVRERNARKMRKQIAKRSAAQLGCQVPRLSYSENTCQSSSSRSPIASVTRLRATSSCRHAAAATEPSLLMILRSASDSARFQC